MSQATASPVEGYRTGYSENCPLCAEDGESALWRDAFCRVIWVDDARFPGFCRVILNAHVREMSDLTASQQRRFMHVVFTVEAALRAAAQPDKINLASLGNVVPHLHWHVIPRWTDDSHFPDAIWATPHRAAPGRDAVAIRARLQADIPARLRSPPD